MLTTTETEFYNLPVKSTALEKRGLPYPMVSTQW